MAGKMIIVRDTAGTCARERARRTHLGKEQTMTRKLMLDLEALTVTTFEVEAERMAMRGTVEAREMNSNNSDPLCCGLTIRTCASWEFSCRAEDQA
jgi:hypothetical protein